MRKYLIFGCVLLLGAVIFGAFGAHYLKAQISPERLAIYQTAIDYQFIHSLGILIISIFLIKYNTVYFKYAIYCFMVGIFCFSGSLYFLAIRELIDLNINFLLGPLTPIGGLFFILGWSFSIFGFLKTEL